MNKQKICIIGDGLSGLTSAAVLSKQSNIIIDLYIGNKKKDKKIDTRTTAISESNFEYIKSNLNFKKDSFFGQVKKLIYFLRTIKKLLTF